MKERFVKLLSCFIPSEKLRHRFRAYYSNSVIADYGKNNKFIVLDDSGNKTGIKKIKNFKVCFYGDNNTIILHKDINLPELTFIEMSSHNYFEIGKSKYHFCLDFPKARFSEYSKLIIGENCQINRAMFILKDEPNCLIKIGDNCMLSWGVEIWPTDSHTIYDETTKEILNSPKDIKIGNHCWISKDVIFLKGAVVPDNSVIGMRSIYTSNSNSKENGFSGGVFAGIPAKLIKSGINWDRPNTYDFKMNREEIINK